MTTSSRVFFCRPDAFALILTTCLFPTACVSVSEGDRQLVDQVLKSSSFVLNGVAFGPEQVQAIIDIKKNSEVLQANLGSPKTSVPYSPEASESARKKATEQHENPWWKVLMTTLVGVALGGGTARALVSVFPRMIGGPVGAAFQSLVEGVAAARQSAAAQGTGNLPVGRLLEILSEHQEDEGVREYVAAYAKKLEARMGVELPSLKSLRKEFPNQIPPS